MLVSDPTPVERGKAARKSVPRGSHAEFTAAPGRTDPVETLERQSRTRIAELIPIRYGRMLNSPSVLAQYAEELAPRDVKRVEKGLAKARTKDSRAAVRPDVRLDARTCPRAHG